MLLEQKDKEEVMEIISSFFMEKTRVMASMADVYENKNIIPDEPGKTSIC